MTARNFSTGVFGLKAAWDPDTVMPAWAETEVDLMEQIIVRLHTFTPQGLGSNWYEWRGDFYLRFSRVGAEDAIELLMPPDDGWRLDIAERWEQLDDAIVDELRDLTHDSDSAGRGFDLIMGAVRDRVSIVDLTEEVIANYDKQAYDKYNVSAAIAERGVLERAV
jgi:hypothetical protein